ELARAFSVEAGLEHLAEIDDRVTADLDGLVDLAVLVVVEAVREEEPRELGLRHDVRLRHQRDVAVLGLVLRRTFWHRDLIVAAVTVGAPQLVVRVRVPRGETGVAIDAAAVEAE